MYILFKRKVLLLVRKLAEGQVNKPDTCQLTKAFGLHYVSHESSSFIVITDFIILLSMNTVLCIFFTTNLISTLPGNSSVITVQQARVEKAVFSLDPTDVPIDWLDRDHVICVYLGNLRPYNGDVVCFQ
jgi:hypothetical protein